MATLELRPAHLRALLCLAEAAHLTGFLTETRGADYFWPGFDFKATPIVLFRGNLEAFLVQFPHPPAGFSPLNVPMPGLERTPVYYHRGALPYLPAVGAVEIEDRVAASLPLSVFRPEAVPEALVAGLVHEAFHAYERGLGRGRVDLSLVSGYPELSPANNALGNMEGRILYDYLSPRFGRCEPQARARSDGEFRGDGESRGDDESLRAAFDFSRARRERRGPLEDSVIEYERQLEAAEGLARYVEVRALLGGMSAYRPSRAFQVLTGRETYTQAPRLVAEQVAKLPQLNVKAAGAAWWRFFHTGMALALLADDLDPDWKGKVGAGPALDEVIEGRVTYDGGSSDERAIEELKERYGYDQRLEAEREFGREEKRRKRDLLALVLQGTGTRVTFDVSALIAEETWWESGRISLDWDPASTETITKNVRIHRKGLRFSGFGTDLRFAGIPVVEDRKSRLFHVNVPKAGRLDMRGDGRACSLEKPAEFEDGLTVLLPGVSARARSGYVREAGGTLYIRITR
jgi:hypothetical protein